MCKDSQRILVTVSHMKRLIGSLFFCGVLLSGAENFESHQSGGFTSLSSEFGQWTAAKGHVEIHDAHSKGGKKSLRILGGGDHRVELQLQKKAAEDVVLSFWAERWTSRSPFQFRIEEKRAGKWTEIYNGDKKIKVGGFLTLVEVPLKKGLEGLRFEATSPEKSGLMIDDLLVEKVQPMVVEKITTMQPVVPALIRKKDNPVLGLQVVAKGRGAPKKVTAVKVDLEGTTDPKAVKVVRLLSSGGSMNAREGKVFGEGKRSGKEWVFQGEAALFPGENYFWVSVELNDDASLDAYIDARVLEVKLDDGTIEKPEVASPEGKQRIGYGLRLHGDDGSRGFRIPGLATTNKGTLIGVYDIRYRGGGDLPGDIDVGMSRSTDGGQTWEKMKNIMDMGNDPKWRYDGVGDPAVLVDKGNGRIWVIGTWSHGNRSWRGSGQGMSPEETGQLMLVYSDDDGVSWSKPINITKQVKKPEWHFLLQGPGAGITMKNGTIVFAAQYQDGDKRPDGRKKGTPFSTILYSKNHGETWTVGTGIKSNTTEAQVVELKDGSLMLNCRDNRGGARTIGVSKDMGKTWELHATDRKALDEPVCMASLLRMGDRLIFSNPNSRRGRFNMTIKVSDDDGMTWPEEQHTLYDSRGGNGYSCLAPIGDDHVGVLYEGVTELYFLKFSIRELVK
ncbi:exo-alpha-sialidase [Akkermansiaceae bacterium]|nr:exo-alpha-sialidase [Akkermansiaceae bacterium]